MPAETYQNKYNMVFHENANCTVMNDVQFHQPVTIVSGDKTFLNETEMPSREEEEKEDITDELYAILQDKELYEETVKWAKTCSRPRDIKSRICEPLRRAGFKNLGRDFAKALIPHLTKYESAKDVANIERSLL